MCEYNIIREIDFQSCYPVRQQALYPHADLEAVKIPLDFMGKHFGLYTPTGLKSVISVFLAEEAQIQFRKFATLPQEQGKGYGSYLLNHVIEYAKNELKAKGIWCHARSNKQHYYQKFGLMPQGESYTREDISYVKMQRAL